MFIAILITLNALAGIRKPVFFTELILKSLWGLIFIYMVNIRSTWTGNCEKEVLFPLQDVWEAEACKLLENNFYVL